MVQLFSLEFLAVYIFSSWNKGICVKPTFKAVKSKSYGHFLQYSVWSETWCWWFFFFFFKYCSRTGKLESNGLRFHCTTVMFSVFWLVIVRRSIFLSRVMIVRFEDGLKKKRRRKLLPNERKKQTKVIPSLCTLLKYTPSLYHVCLFFTTQNKTTTNTNKIEWRGMARLEPVSLWLTSTRLRPGPKCHPCHCPALCVLKNCCNNYLPLPV